MIPFSLEMPVAIHFGSGSLRKLPDIVAGLGKRVLLVSGRQWLAGSGWEGAIASGLAGCAVERWSCPAAEPATDTLEAAAGAVARFSPDVLVAVGGGSVLDSTKALSALLSSPARRSVFSRGWTAPFRFRDLACPGLPFLRRRAPALKPRRTPLCARRGSE